MRRILITSVALGGAVALSGASRAGYVNVTIEPYVGEGWVENGYAGLTAWRVYVNFDGGPLDGVLSLFGTSDPYRPWSMTSTDGDFHNAVLDDICPPEDRRKEGYWENQWDTYVAFGEPSLPSYTCPAGPEFGKATGWLAHSFACLCGLFLTPDDEQAYAVDGRFFIGQFVVAQGETVNGSLNLLLLDGRHEQGVVITPVSCEGDVDLNAVVEFADLLAVLAAWGPCEGCPEDVDGDGEVGFSDVLALLAAWGPCGR